MPWNVVKWGCLMNQKSVKKNYLYRVLHQVLLIVIPLVIFPYISRVLNPEGVGEYSFTNSVITFFVIFAGLGFNTYAQREVAKYRDNSQQESIIFWEIILCRLCTVGLSLIINLILILCGGYGEYTMLMSILSLNILTVAFDITFFFQGHEEFGKIALLYIVIKILSLVAVFAFVKQQSDVWIYVLINSLVVILSNLILWFFLRKRLVKVPIRQLKPLRHLKGTLLIFISTLGITIYSVLDKSLIGLITHSNVENGYYEMAEKIVRKTLLVITCLSEIMLSRNTYEVSSGSKQEIQTNNYRSFHFLWLLGLPISLGIIFTAGNFIPWLLGSGFKQSILLTQVLSSLILIIGIGCIVGQQYLLPYKKDHQFTVAILVGVILNVVLNLPFISLWGALGAVLATVFAELAVTCLMLFFVSKELSLWGVFQSAIKPLIATVIMSAVIFPLSIYLSSNILNSIIMIVVGGMIYSVSILILRDSMVIQTLRDLKKKLFKKD